MNLLLPISFGLAIVLFLNNTKNVKNEIKNKNCNPRFWNIGENFEYVEKINEDESLCYLLSTKFNKTNDSEEMFRYLAGQICKFKIASPFENESARNLIEAIVSFDLANHVIEYKWGSLDKEDLSEEDQNQKECFLDYPFNDMYLSEQAKLEEWCYNNGLYENVINDVGNIILQYGRYPL